LVSQIADHLAARSNGTREPAQPPPASSGAPAASSSPGTPLPATGSASTPPSTSAPGSAVTSTSTSAVTSATSSGPASSVTPAGASTGSTSGVTSAPSNGPAAGSTNSSTTANSSHGQSELSQILSAVTNLFHGVLQSGNRSQPAGHGQGLLHVAHATYSHRGQLVSSTNSTPPPTDSDNPLQQLVQMLADETGKALGSTAK
jgi:hypothetical protein